MRPASNRFGRLPPHLRSCVQVGVLVCALLLAQLLGLAHSVLHGAESQPNPPSLQGIATIPPVLVGNPASAEASSSAGSWLVRIFSTHEAGTDCQLYDQACHGSAVSSVVALVLPTPWAYQVFDISRGKALARWAALFDARGPPQRR